jgi:hypothetical protein
MKQIRVYFFLVLILFSVELSGDESNRLAGTFMLHENARIYLSFESYKMKDGWTPLVLSLDGIDCLLWMDASGNVSEGRETHGHGIAPLFFIDPLNLTLGKGADVLYFDVYEQNPTRSRWRLSSYETPGQMTKKIRFHREGIDFYMGNLWLPVHRVWCDFFEISPGLFRVQLNGPMATLHGCLIYEKATGIIYSTPVWGTAIIPGHSHTWATKLVESGKPVTGGE